jgi:polyisoprenyl-teichoic acid--peptidoglycan teichoic acid transferase
VLGAVLPGAGYLWGGLRLLGALVLLASLALVAVAGYGVRDFDAALELAFDAARLRVAAVTVTVVLAVWAIVVVTTYLLVRPRGMGWVRNAAGGVFVALLCLAVAAPAVVSSRYATVQAGLVRDVFEGNETATAPRDVTVHDPWGGRDRVSVLLMGGDGSVTRDGIRTDTLILLTMDTRTGRTVMFSLPRNMMNAPFPEDSPLHELYPDGFRGEGDPGAWMLNAVYGQVPALHPGVLGDSDNEGADAVKQAVEGTLGIPVDYYMLVNLNGFQQIVDAMGGVTVNINEPVAIHGNTDLGIPPVGYLEPGPNQRLDGYHALWFARGRWGSDDYERMLRQRCMVQAIIDEADPINLLRRYEALVAAGKEIVRTDVPAQLLPALVDLALKVKNTDVRSVAFVSSERFFPGDPDFAWVQETVQRAIQPPPPRPARPGDGPDPAPTPTATPTPGAEPEPDPGEAVEVEDSCGYHPEQ